MVDGGRYVRMIVLKDPQERKVAELRDLAEAMAWLPLFNQLSPLHRLLCAKVGPGHSW